MDVVGMNNIMCALLPTFLRFSHGVRLGQEGNEQMYRARIALVVQDEKGHKELFQFKGASISKRILGNACVAGSMLPATQST